MARRSVNFTVIPVKSTSGRQLSLVDASQKMQGDTRAFPRPVGITHAAAHRKWHQITRFPKFGGAFRAAFVGRASCLSFVDRQARCLSYQSVSGVGMCSG
jgi:hypothetical protein